jgi:hypothetical protein
MQVKKVTRSAPIGSKKYRSRYQQLQQFGASTLESPQDVGGDIRVAMVKDPWGNPFGIIVNPHFGTPIQKEV